MEYLSKEELDIETEKYSREYEKMHISTLEHKIQEKDRLLFELSGINQDIYMEMTDVQEKFVLSRVERDKLLEENIRLKDEITDKNTIITQQETTISKLRYQISELSNGNSLLYEDKSTVSSSNKFMMNELKALQAKYDSREDLIISLQEERVKFLNEIDRLRGGFRTGFETFQPRSLI